MKKAFITGVTGQSGSTLADHLIELGYEVIGLYRRASTNNFWRIDHLLDHPRFQLECGDITDLSSLLRVVSKVKPDEIYNLAAQSHVGVSFDEPLHTWDVTAAGALNVLETVRLVNPAIRVYQASSSEMFGSYVDPDGFQRETTPMHPCSPYAAAKLAAHNAVRLYRDSYKLFACSGILMNHESARRSPEFVTRKITQYVAKLHVLGPDQAGKLHLGNLHARRDWGHAKDYVRAMHLMLQQDYPGDYVVATGRTWSVRQFLELAFSRVGLSNWGDYVVLDEKFLRPCEVPHLKGDASKARKVLGWKPTVSFEELVYDMVDNDIAQLRA